LEWWIININVEVDEEVCIIQSMTDGTNTYLYGLGRIAQTQGTATDYFLSDALGSVRQLTDQTGAITYARTYDPYGVATQTAGAAQTPYGYTGEYTSNDLVYLRARHYDPGMGRFLTRDTWGGNYSQPLTINRWNYTEANPINWIDPTGHITENDNIQALIITEALRIDYNVNIIVDWGYPDWLPSIIYGMPIPNLIPNFNCGEWQYGNWENLQELEWVRNGVQRLATKMGSPAKFKAAVKNRPVEIARVKTLPPKFENYTGLALPEIPLYFMVDGLMLPDSAFDTGELFATYTTIHELGHVWDIRSSLWLSIGMATQLNNAKPGHNEGLFQCLFNIGTSNLALRWKCAMDYWQYDSANEVAPGKQSGPYAATSITEDWAEAVAYTVYPQYGQSQTGFNEIQFIRKTFVEMMIEGIY
jgi:RHS repeat-associated protein